MIGRINHRNHRRILPRLELHHRIARRRISILQRGFRSHSQIAAVIAGLRVLGIIHGQRGKIVSTIQAIGNHLNFLFRLRIVLRFAVLQIVHLPVPRSRYHDLRQMILRFDQIKLGLVLVVVAGNIGVRDVDARGDFLVQHLVACKRAPQVALKIFE